MSPSLPRPASIPTSTTTAPRTSARPTLAMVARWLRPASPRSEPSESLGEPHTSLADTVTEARLWRLRDGRTEV